METKFLLHKAAGRRVRVRACMCYIWTHLGGALLIAFHVASSLGERHPLAVMQKECRCDFCFFPPSSLTLLTVLFIDCLI